MNISSAAWVVFSAALVGMFILLTGGCWAETFEARVVGVSAGDIFKVRRGGQSELVVLYGVEAPNTRSLAGKEAKRFATDRILDREASVEVMDRREGLTLVRVRLEDGSDLAELMLRQGLVKWDALSAPKDQRLIRLEELAQAGGRGLWRKYPEEAPAPGLRAGVIAEELILVSNPEGGLEYHIIDGRVMTDSAGIKTLILRGNGRKKFGFEAAVERRRKESQLAYLEELRREEEEFFQQQQEALRFAAEEDARRQAEWQQQFESERAERDYWLNRVDNTIHVWSTEYGWIR